jgi:hypothetical protein
MSIFNKHGIEFKHPVQVPLDPNGPPPTYTHSFPVIGKRGKVEERWSTKVRPIKDLTRILQGCRLKRNQDYMIEYNEATQMYEYWFLDPRNQLMFAIAASTVKQSHAAQGPKFDIQCPHCLNQFATKDITWK